MVRLGEDGAIGNTTRAVDRFRRRVKHGYIRHNGSKRFGHVPAADRATEIDVGDNNVDGRTDVAQGDSRFPGADFDDDKASILQIAGDIEPHEAFVLDDEDYRTIVGLICG